MGHEYASIPAEKADFYDKSYQKENFFQYKAWLYSAYISSLIAFCGLNKGDSILDVGCGQGFFSYLFARRGMKVRGIDVSETGIRKAETSYSRLGISFAVSDIQTATFSGQFDCIFVRSCSLYNTKEFPFQTDLTDRILNHLKPGGTFIFVYNSTFSSKRSTTWRYHSLDDVRKHFSKYSGAQIFFVSRLATYVLRQYSLSPFVTRRSVLLSKLSGTGGDIICILRKAHSNKSAATEMLKPKPS